LLNAAAGYELGMWHRRATASGVRHNVYVFRIEIADGHIVRVDEYANPVAWTALGLD
jgi:ketosteroid isomerase-like protein